MSYEVIIDVTNVKHTNHDFKDLFYESIPCKERIVRCRDCLSWHRGKYFKHVYTVIDECDNEYEEGVFPMDADDFCSLGTRREEA